MTFARLVTDLSGTKQFRHATIRIHRRLEVGTEKQTHGTNLAGKLTLAGTIY